QFHRFLIESLPGSKISLGISRRGVAQSLDVVLGQVRSAAQDELQRLYNTPNAMLASADESHRQAVDILQKGDWKGQQKFLEGETLFREPSAKYRADIDKDVREGKIVLSRARRPGYNANRYQIGVIANPLTAQLAGFFNATKDGVVIPEVRAGELGERAGLKA